MDLCRFLTRADSPSLAARLMWRLLALTSSCVFVFCSPTWHCVIGTNFGSHVVHATKNFIYFYLGPKAILLFKSG